MAAVSDRTGSDSQLAARPARSGPTPPPARSCWVAAFGPAPPLAGPVTVPPCHLRGFGTNVTQMTTLPHFLLFFIYYFRTRSLCTITRLGCSFSDQPPNTWTTTTLDRHRLLSQRGMIADAAQVRHLQRHRRPCRATRVWKDKRVMSVFNLNKNRWSSGHVLKHFIPQLDVQRHRYLNSFSIQTASKTEWMGFPTY